MSPFPQAPQVGALCLPDVLLHAYRNHLSKMNSMENNAEVVALAEAAEKFTEFSKEFLDKKRPTALSNSVDRNYQITLGSGPDAIVCVIAPVVPAGILPVSEAISCNRN